MKKSKISVIIPSFNSGEFLDEAIESAVKQTYSNLEIILVNDGSKDKTESIIKKWQNGNQRIKYLKHIENEGLSASRNDAIKKAKGEYIAFLDADDVWFPQKIEKQLDFIREKDKDLIFSNWYIWNLEKKTKKEAFSKNPIRDHEEVLGILLRDNFGNSSTAFLKKDVFKKVGYFDKSLKSSEDYDFWLRCCLNNLKLGFIEEPLILYRVYSEQMTSNTYRMRTSRLKVFEKIVKKRPKLLMSPILLWKILLLRSYKLFKDFLNLF